MTLNPPRSYAPETSPPVLRGHRTGPSLARRITSLACYTQPFFFFIPPPPPPNSLLRGQKTDSGQFSVSLVRRRATDCSSPLLQPRTAMERKQELTGKIPHSEHRFPAPSSKLCQIWLHHRRGTLDLRSAVHRRGQRPPKGLGTNI